MKSIRPIFVLPALGVLLLACLLGYHEIYSPDIGFQLSLGRWIVENRAIPGRDPLTYTFGENPYVDLQWLYQVALWFTHSAGGTLAVILGNTLVTLAAIGLALARTIRRERVLPVMALLPVLLFAMGNIWEVRPHVVSWVYLGTVLLLLEEYHRKPGRFIWGLPAVMVCWVNTHSLFALGIAAIGANVVTEMAAKKTSMDRRLVAAAVLACFVCLINPYGLKGLEFPLAQLRMLQGASTFKSGLPIREFRPPLDFTPYTDNRALVIYQPLLFLQFYGLLALISVPFFWRRTNWSDRLVFAMFFYVYWTGRKNFGYFAMASIPFVSAGLVEMARWFRTAIESRTGLSAPTLRRALAVALVLACLAAALQVLSGYMYASRRTADRAGHCFNQDQLPVGAATFLNRPDVPPGRMLNSIGDGGFLHFATRRPVFIDGRLELVGSDFYRRWSMVRTPEGLGRVIRDYSIELVVVPYSELHEWLELLHAHPAWRCVYVDELTAVFFRNGFAEHVGAVTAPVAGRDYRHFNNEEQRRVIERAIPRKDPGLFQSFFGKHYYPLPQVRLSAVRLLFGHAEAALATGLDGLDSSTFDAPDLLLNTANALWALGRRQTAGDCYRAVIESRTWRNMPAATRMHARQRLLESGR